MAENVDTIQGDFLSARVQLDLHERIDQVLKPNLATGRVTGGVVDLVMSDMMCAMSGVRTRDVQGSLQLCEVAWDFGKRLLRMKTEDEPEWVMRGSRKAYPGGNMM
jgi:23S rRNA U2552 (ribose-2'-O)-methylase RlmE/FtsJ